MRLPLVSSFPLPPRPGSLVSKLPAVLLKPATHSPFILQRLVFETVLKQVFREAIADGDFDFLKNKYLKLEISDLNLCWFFTFDGRQLTVSQHGGADAGIRGELREFLLLITRQEDPDTLFFQRRLQINGDTELGLSIKNMLDTIDMDNMPRLFRKGCEQLADLLAR